MHRQNRWTGIVVGVVLGVLFSAAVVWAGILEPSAGPTEAGSQMYTLDQIYHRLNNGLEATKMTTFTEPSSGPTAGTMHTLDEIYDLIGVSALRFPGPGRLRQFPLIQPRPVPTAPFKKAWPGRTLGLRITVNGTVTDNLTGLIWLKNANCTIRWVE